MSGPVSAAVHVIRSAKAGLGTDEGTAVLDDLDRDELVSVLRLLYPMLGELYDTVQASQRAMQARTDRAFGDLVQRLTEGDA
ncbi:hypothetical protein [Mycobacteroides chelonae]|uniref:hypothetical protein n=1 Tax=Mycobacteroides chelonae TaxID=1774 RepID=UPI0018B07089|nr:hypothetical protein [Mycobacteroides chelonae]MBF9316551.1 hypothetical protein [Mycobacteroides chelonae]